MYNNFISYVCRFSHNIFLYGNYGLQFIMYILPLLDLFIPKQHTSIYQHY